MTNVKVGVLGGSLIDPDSELRPPILSMNQFDQNTLSQEHGLDCIVSSFDYTSVNDSIEAKIVPISVVPVETNHSWKQLDPQSHEPALSANR